MREHPDPAAAFNNLAQTLVEGNDLQEALAAANGQSNSAVRDIRAGDDKP